MNQQDQKHTPPSTAPAAGLPDLPGVDMPAALALMGGNQALLLRAARTFLRDYVELPDNILLAYREQRYPDVCRLAHNMKSASAYLCAAPLAAVSLTLEHAARAGAVEQMAEALPLFLRQVATVLDGLKDYAAAERTAMPAAAPAEAFDAQRRAAALALTERIAPLLGAGNYAAGALLEQLGDTLKDSKWAGRTHVIREMFDDLETDGAAGLLAALARELR